ncbi:SusC/RagA family TonB-linked outer membrane protein [Chitinophaga arvensicola]|uniref:TonB-linked outer membrane protein, SusC/RagA family n=1 Tax=Chitinophaga arvensicola TaxID=29529 RepID=A0A1I0PM57_9BACT|nr:SusC/RagA family TonB-linked outer membrane protein [Chitinophaga arvensicola]SEW14898.1 TonB-linked outer membrane protein, SusC/RagA family [Chitinophaga arvensicola]
MRLTAILLTVAFLQVKANAVAQNVTLTGKDLTLKEVFSAIKKQTGYVVFSKKALLTDAKPVTLTAQDMPLRTLLDLALKNQSLDYVIQDKTIILSGKAPVAPLKQPDFYTVGQERRLKIQVIGHQSKPLAGASVAVKNNTRSISGVTDSDGIFDTELQEGDVLMVSFVGYETRSIVITGEMLAASNKLVVGLQPSVIRLDNVEIVQTGYQTLSKERATGSFSKPDMKVFSQRSSSMDLIGRLDGQIPGLTVRRDFNTDAFTKASTQKALVRGTGSVSLSTEPLYVLNGVVIKDFSLVNMDDVEDITVLKDAAAAAIWGAQASNGVIVVVTKSGKKNQKVKFSYNGFTEVKGRPDMGYRNFMNSKQFIQAARETFDPVANPYDYLSFDQVAPHTQIMYDQYLGKISAAQANASLDSLANLDNTSQIKSLLFSNTVTTNHNISASGGSGAYSFYSSLGYTGTTGGLPGEKNDVFRLGLNQSYTPNDRLSISVNAQLSNTKGSSKNNFNYNSDMVPYQLFRGANGNNLSMPYMVSYYSGEQRQIYQDLSGVDLQTYIPLDEFNYANSTTNILMANLVGDIGVKLWKGISFKGTYGYSTSPRTMQYYEDHTTYNQRNNSIRFIPLDGSPSYLPLTGGTLITNNANQRNWTVRNQLLYNYSGRDGKDLVNLQVGHEANESLTTSIETTVLGWDRQLQTAPYVDYKKLSEGVFNTVTGSGFFNGRPYVSNEVRSRFNSYFALASYQLDHKYSVDASWRVDHSNLFGSDISAQNKPVYSIGGKWRINNEDFLKSVSWIDQLAIRATYGVTGNSPYIGSATSYDVIAPEQYLSYPQIGGPSYRLNSPANNKLVWETSKTLNFGLDFGVLDGRLSGSIEYYNKKTSNLIGSVPTDLFTGLSTITANIGDLANQGINININSVNVKSRNFTWNTSVVFAFNKNKLLSYTAPQSYESQAYFRAIANYVVGYSMEPVFAFKYAGLDNVGDPQIKLANGKITKDPQAPMAEDLVYMGSVVPKFNGGITNTFSYKQFTLSLNMVYSLGAVMRRDVNGFYTGLLNAHNDSPDFMNRWKKPGDEKITNIPSYTPDINYNYTDRNTNFYTQSDINILSASYLKLREATLSYDLPSVLMNWLKIQSASLRVQVNNVMLWKNNNAGIDPEYYTYKTGYRNIRVGEHAFAVGANINF